MPAFHRLNPELIARLFIAAVWIFHGLYSKLLQGIPRHQEIVARILGDSLATPATILIGTMEIILGLWVLSRFYPEFSAAVQTAALVSMNTLEIILAPDLLISAIGMVALNLLFITLIWWWATRKNQPPSEI